MTESSAMPGEPQRFTYAGYLSRRECYPIKVDTSKKWHDPVNIPSKYWDRLSLQEQTVLQMYAESEELSADQKKEHKKTFKNVCSRLQQWFKRSDPKLYAEEKKRTAEYNLAVKKGDIEPLRSKHPKVSYGNRACPIKMKEFHSSASSGSCTQDESGCAPKVRNFSRDIGLMMEPKFSDSVGCLLNHNEESCLFVSNVAIPSFILESSIPTGMCDFFELKMQDEKKALNGDPIVLAPILSDLSHLDGVGHDISIT